MATARRLRIRLSLIVLILAAMLILGLAGLSAHPKPVHAQAADPSKAAIVLALVDTRNRGDYDAAAALFADNASYIGAAAEGTCTLKAPCYDQASILGQLQTTGAFGSNCQTVTTIQVTGDIVTARVEVRNDLNRAIGVERVVNWFMVEVRDGKIYSMYQRRDLGDPLTALAAAITAGTAQAETPIPTPNPPCGG